MRFLQEFTKTKKFILNEIVSNVLMCMAWVAAGIVIVGMVLTMSSALQRRQASIKLPIEAEVRPMPPHYQYSSSNCSTPVTEEVCFEDGHCIVATSWACDISIEKCCRSNEGE